jgi:hypothetical protein
LTTPDGGENSKAAKRVLVEPIVPDHLMASVSEPTDVTVPIHIWVVYVFDASTYDATGFHPVVRVLETPATDSVVELTVEMKKTTSPT